MREEMEVSFDSGNDESAPKNGRQRLNDFLALLVFGGRADLEPTLYKTGIALQEIQLGAAGGVFCDATNQELPKSSCAKPRYRPGTSMDCK